MIIPTPRTWTAGEVVANSYLAANMQSLGNYLLAPPIGILRQSVAQSVASATYTSVLFDAEDIDRDNAHSTSTNTSRFTANTAGYYWVSGVVAFPANSTGQRIARFAVNGTSGGVQAGVAQISANSSSSGTGLTVSRLIYLNVNDYLELQCYQDSGAALSLVVAAPVTSTMSVLWVSQ